MPLVNADGAPLVAPKPTITIELTPMDAGGDGQFYFEAQVTMTHMPGGWKTVHHGLCLALEKVMTQIVQEGQTLRERVTLAHALPTNGTRTPSA